MDYQSNANKNKEQPLENQPKVEKIVTGEVIQKPKSVGRKFKNIFFGGDAKAALRFVSSDVLLPALRSLIVDMTSKGIERVVYGESSYRRRPAEYRPRIQYNTPIYYRPQDPRDQRYANLPDQARPYRTRRREPNDFIVGTRQEADEIVEDLINAIDKYQVVSLADLYVKLGLETSYVDQKWGWTYLNNIEVRQHPQGYLIDLPPLEEI